MYAIYLTSPNNKKRPVDGDPGFNHFLQLFQVAFPRKLLQSKLSIQFCLWKYASLWRIHSKAVSCTNFLPSLEKRAAGLSKIEVFAFKISWHGCWTFHVFNSRYWVMSKKVWCLKWVLCVFSFLDPWGMLFVLIANKVVIKDQACYWKIF